MRGRGRKGGATGGGDLDRGLPAVGGGGLARDQAGQLKAGEDGFERVRSEADANREILDCRNFASAAKQAGEDVEAGFGEGVARKFPAEGVSHGVAGLEQCEEREARAFLGGGAGSRERDERVAGGTVTQQRKHRRIIAGSAPRRVTLLFPR